MAREVEEIVTANGAVPATVGILRGRIHVGLTDEELEFLASSKNVVKVSRRDLPFILSQVWYADFLLCCFLCSNSIVLSSFKPRWLLKLLKISRKVVSILLVISNVVLSS